MLKSLINIILFVPPILIIYPDIAESQFVYYQFNTFDVNNISTVIRNDGMLDYLRFNAPGSGMEWPKGSDNHIIYASLPWFAAKVNGEVRIAAMEYSSIYNPGPMNAATHKPINRLDTTYRVYKIQLGDTSSWDYLHWPSALGAPIDQYGKPLLLGDQTLWSVFNCADSTQVMPYDSKPLGLEVQQTIFGYWRLGGLFRNLMLVHYLIINKSGSFLDSMYFGYWSDPDIGAGSNDCNGCDSVLSVWYTYHSSDSEMVYGLHPPAVGFITLQGPRVPSTGDSARYRGSIIRNYKNLPMTSFITWPNDSWSNPRTAANVYDYFRSIWWYSGKHITYGNYGLDSLSLPTNFMYTGDPETGTGWLSAYSSHQFSGNGPFTMAPGDTQEVTMGILISRGTSNTNSVTRLKSETQVLRGIYNDSLYKLFAPPPGYWVVPELYSLSQNFPNPFNSGTEIRFGLPIDANVKLSIYNILGQRIAILASGFYRAGVYKVLWEPGPLASGIYIYQLDAGRYIKSRRMLLLK